MLSDFPKIQCPFVRKTYKVNKDDFKKYGSELQLRTPEVYLVVDEINPGFEWVFDDKDTIAVEKLDGTNVKLETDNGRLIALQNRTNIIDPLQIISGKAFIVEGIFTAIQKGYVETTGIQAGELIGPKLQGNPYNLSNHLWYPFEKAIKHLRYNCFHAHERTFYNWSSWFKTDLQSRFYTKTKLAGSENFVMAEGVIFYNLKRKAEKKSYMAKLRRDMFEWFYSDEIEIYDCNRNYK